MINPRATPRTGYLGIVPPTTTLHQHCIYNLEHTFKSRMGELQDSMDTAILPGSDWENQWNEPDSSQSTVELTPPSTSSVGELTPAASDNDVLSDSIGSRSESHNSNSSIVKLATAIETVVSSLVKTASPLARQQAWASVQTIAEDNIARIAERELSWPKVSIPKRSLSR